MAEVQIYHKAVNYKLPADRRRAPLRKNLTSNINLIFNRVSRKLDLKDNEAIVTLFSGCTYIDQKAVINFIKENNIKKVYFFIEDVFRLYSTEHEFDVLETYPLYCFSDTVFAYELDIIKRIIKKAKCEYRIFHCEKDCNILSKRYNLKIEYFDWYFLEYARLAYHSDKSYKTSISQKISCFNLRGDWHRHIISVLIKDFDVVLSLNNPYSAKKLTNNRALPIEFFSFNIQSKIIENHHSLKGLPITHDQKSKNKDSVIEIDPKNQNKNIDAIASAFVNVVTETRYVSDMVNFTEKTVKPMLVRRPFIMLGSIGSLAHLRELGFKTFDKWWDESYDLEKDHNKRLEMVYNIVKSINDKPLDELNEMLNEMNDILEHNYNNLGNLTEKMLNYLD